MEVHRVGNAAPGGLRLAASAQADSPGSRGETPHIILDTNVVFDWLLFSSPESKPLAAAIHGRRVRWIATPRMMDECFNVIGRGALDAWLPKKTAIRDAWTEHCSIVEPPNSGLVQSAPRCSDADDQMFVDLAIVQRARWLLSKDRAVLRLAPSLWPYGVTVTRLAGWTEGSNWHATGPQVRRGR